MTKFVGGVVAVIVLAGGLVGVPVAAADPLPGMGRITGHVWYDKDLDEVRDADETGIGSVQVTAINRGPDGVYYTADDVSLPNATTDSTGVYAFDVDAGHYRIGTVASTAPTGMIRHGADTRSMSVAVGDEKTSVDLAYKWSGVINSKAWNDVDADGTFDSSESPLPGLDVTLTSAGADNLLGTSDDEPVKTIATDSAGRSQFRNLPPGSYRSTIDVADAPSGSAITTPGHRDSTLGAGSTVDTAGFGFRFTGSIGDRIWFDADFDGTLDIGEAAVSGAVVNAVFAGADATIGTADDVAHAPRTTDAAGAYLFSYLAPGTYSVSVDESTLQTGRTVTSRDNPSVVTLDPHEADAAVDFGTQWAGSIGDRVWLDTDADGVQDGGEPGVAGATVTLRTAGADATLGTADDTAAGTRTTAASGAYEFANARPASYRVSVDPSTAPAGTALTTGSWTDVTIAPAEAVTTADFGFRWTGTIGDRVWKDEDADGVQDAGEAGAGGMEVLLLGAGADATWFTADDSEAMATTGAGGDYSFPNLAPGQYQVIVLGSSAPPAMVLATPSVTLTLAAGEARSDLDFALVWDSSIGDRVWLDADADGAQDAGEGGVAAVAVALWDVGPDGTWGTSDDSSAGTTTTASDGAYAFPHVRPGSYRIAIDGTTIPAGMGLTTGATFGITLEAHEQEDDVDFGVRWTASIGDRVWLDRDADGQQDADETEGFDGVEVRLVRAG
ncbi:MAG TPA: SdrD B-like domain-containing protein, partial [Acidimicrobiales bacterium]